MSTIKLERIFKALANRRRLEILNYLRKRGLSTVEDISLHLDLSFKATSKHLIKLSGAGLIDRIQRSTYMFYFMKTDLVAVCNKVLAKPYSLE